MKKEELSIFREILKKNTGLLRKISENIEISEMTLRRISITGIGNEENKNKILNYLIDNNYIREGEYTITEFFDI
ncbi:hypothetical protein DLH72_04040 [Candidatus Gracilibacteria bacterium]|nr:MAG: hypothetical protein DLH72_04040 [Candidatus Gracilibacteria bacterium]